jgi:hypothetical protein
METAAYCPSKLHLYDTSLILLTNETHEQGGELRIGAQTLAENPATIWIPERKQKDTLVLLSDLIQDEEVVAKIVKILAAKTAKKQPVLGRRNISHQQLTANILKERDVLAWAQILADIRQRNIGRVTFDTNRNNCVIFGDIYDRLLNVFLHAFAAYRKGSTKAAAEELERRTNRSFVLGSA